MRVGLAGLIIRPEAHSLYGGDGDIDGGNIDPSGKQNGGEIQSHNKEVDNEVDAESQIQIPTVMHDNEQIWWGSYSTC